MATDPSESPDVQRPEDVEPPQFTYPFATEQGKQISDAIQEYINVLLQDLKPQDEQ